ncbi:MAG TPA: S8 family serine peptidase, partial [Solirubrobacterales bacterium]|nr:S8 family serine peptidase [Solirubrobacterales bacterium]
RFSGSSPHFKFVQLGNGSNGVTPTAAQYSTSSAGDELGPTVFGHSGAAGAISVGAVPYDNSATVERYSSRGPVIHYFGPVSGISPAQSIGTQTIANPDLVATDGGANTFFGIPESGIWRFYGTSAAAPHAAAVAALVRQANPGASAAQVRAALTSTARPVGSFATDAIGAGLINAYPAVDSLATAPTITITQPPQALSRNRRPTIQFTANRPVAFACSVDGSAPQPCASPYTVPASLSDGRHGFAVTGTDLGGRAGSSGVASFTIDTTAPRTKIVKHPPRLIRTHQRRARAVFRFRSSETGSTFVCKVDRDLLRTCGKRFALRLEAGRHTVRVRARDQAGNVDATPAIFHFRVKRVG